MPPALSRASMGSRLYYVEVLENVGEDELVVRHIFNVLAPDVEQTLRAARKYTRRAGLDPSAPHITLTDPRLLPGDLIVA